MPVITEKSNRIPRQNNHSWPRRSGSSMHWGTRFSNNRPQAPTTPSDPVQFAQTCLNFHPDAKQAEILRSTAPATIICMGRQTWAFCGAAQMSRGSETEAFSRGRAARSPAWTVSGVAMSPDIAMVAELGGCAVGAWANIRPRQTAAKMQIRKSGKAWPH